MCHYSKGERKREMHLTFTTPPPHARTKDGAHTDRRAQYCDTKHVYGVCMPSRPLQQHAAFRPWPSFPHNDWL